MSDAGVSENRVACTAERRNGCGGDHREDRVDGETGCQNMGLKVGLTNEKYVEPGSANGTEDAHDRGGNCVYAHLVRG